jgi:hypothetical protein
MWEWQRNLFAAVASHEATKSTTDSIHIMSKPKELTAPVIIPAELNLAQVTTYWSQLAAWSLKHSCTMEELYRNYCHDRRMEATVPGCLNFISHMFPECRAGIDLRRCLQDEQKARQADGPGAATRPKNCAATFNNN